MKITKLHWWLPKILCFIAACALWVYVMNEQNPQVENTYTVPVEVRNLDRSLVAVDLPEKVKIVVRMSRSEMINTRSDDIKAYVDLTRADAGDVKGVPIQVVLPSSDETVVSIDPKSVDIRVEPYAVKSLPVTVYFFGTPTESFTPSVQQVTPDTITIAGSRSQVAKASKAVVSVNVANKTESFTEFETVNVLDASGRAVKGLQIMPVQVQIAIGVKEDKRTASLPLVVSTTGTPALGYSVHRVVSSPAMATVTAPVSLFASLKEINLPPVDVSGANASVQRDVTIPIPENATISPATASVSVEIGPSSR